jgi:hypothetical protein
VVLREARSSFLNADADADARSVTKPNISRTAPIIRLAKATRNIMIACSVERYSSCSNETATLIPHCKEGVANLWLQRGGGRDLSTV